MNKYVYFCNHCSFKKILSGTEDLEGLIIIKSSPIQFTIPKIDDATGQSRKEMYARQTKIIKCPKCGFSNRPKLLPQDEGLNDEQNSDFDGR